jgi:DNA-binding GntR family transcriptional regulator
MTVLGSSRAGGRLGTLVYDQLKARLLDGGYAAGERISLEALKAEFNVSKQPIMDAMRRLESAGLTEILPQVGCRVPHYESDEVADFFAMFGGMEAAIAGIAASRWTGNQLAELRELNARIAALTADDDAGSRSHRYLATNREFHARIHRMSASRIIADMSERMWDLCDLLINTAGIPQPLAGAVPQRAHDHDEICAALGARDSAAARVAMEKHILATVGIIWGEASPGGTPRDAAGLLAERQ